MLAQVPKEVRGMPPEGFWAAAGSGHVNACHQSCLTDGFAALPAETEITWQKGQATAWPTNYNVYLKYWKNYSLKVCTETGNVSPWTDQRGGQDDSLHPLPVCCSQPCKGCATRHTWEPRWPTRAWASFASGQSKDKRKPSGKTARPRKLGTPDHEQTFS